MQQLEKGVAKGVCKGVLFMGIETCFYTLGKGDKRTH